MENEHALFFLCSIRKCIAPLFLVSFDSVELLDEALDEVAVDAGRGEQTAHVGLGAPGVVSDHLAAAKVLDLEAELAVALVRFVEGGVAELAPMLSTKNTVRVKAGP